MISMGEAFAEPEKLGLTPKVLQNLWGSAGLCHVKRSAEPEPFFNKLFTM